MQNFKYCAAYIFIKKRFLLLVFYVICMIRVVGEYLLHDVKRNDLYYANKNIITLIKILLR